MKARVDFGAIAARPPRRLGSLWFRTLLERKDLSVFVIEMEPGQSAPALYHAETDEFFLILEGSVRGVVDGKRRVFRKGDFCFLPRGVVHQFTAGIGGASTLDVFFPKLDLKRPDIQSGSAP